MAERRRKPTLEEVNRAFSGTCQLECLACLRECPVNHRYNHSFDCCGRVVAHIMASNLEQRIIHDPQRAGYPVGPSKTRRSA